MAVKSTGVADDVSNMDVLRDSRDRTFPLERGRSPMAEAIGQVAAGNLVPPVTLPDGVVLGVDGRFTADPEHPFQQALRDFATRRP